MSKSQENIRDETLQFGTLGSTEYLASDHLANTLKQAQIATQQNLARSGEVIQ